MLGVSTSYSICVGQTVGQKLPFWTSAMAATRPGGDAMLSIRHCPSVDQTGQPDGLRFESHGIEPTFGAGWRSGRPPRQMSERHRAGCPTSRQIAVPADFQADVRGRTPPRRDGVARIVASPMSNQRMRCVSTSTAANGAAPSPQRRVCRRSIVGAPAEQVAPAQTR